MDALHGSEGGEVRTRSLGYPLRAGAGPWLDAGTGASPTVMYPTGTRTVLESQRPDALGIPQGLTHARRPTKKDRTHFGGYEAAGFDSNVRGGASEVKAVEVGSDLTILDGLIHDYYLPNAGTSVLIPTVGVTTPDEDRPHRPNSNGRASDGRTAIPRFLFTTRDE